MTIGSRDQTKARYEREDTQNVLPVINNVINVINAMEENKRKCTKKKYFNSK